MSSCASKMKKGRHTIRSSSFIRSGHSSQDFLLDYEPSCIGGGWSLEATNFHELLIINLGELVSSRPALLLSSLTPHERPSRQPSLTTKRE